MPTDDERREVARRLREIADRHDGVAATIVERRLGLESDERFLAGSVFTSKSVGRLADLIEPGCDRDTPQKVAEEMFGKMRHSTKEEADAYGAMLKSKSVEIHPVDRDALLALADEMEGGFLLFGSTKSARRVFDFLSDKLGEYARRIREACGEAKA